MNTSIKCVVACWDCSGASDFYACRVTCSKADYDEGGHYEIAENAARGENYEGPMVVFDENDGPEWLFLNFDWSKADEVVSEELED